MESLIERKAWTSAEIMELREKRRQNREEFARSLDVSRQIVFLWEKGRNHPTYRNLRALDALEAETRCEDMS